MALYAFAALGDPRICPWSDGKPIEHACIEYKGPATVLCYAKNGRLLTVDFVGVCYEDGTHCMADDADWVGEQWRFNLTSGQWLYRDVRESHVADVGCSAWPSQRAPTQEPPPKFIQAFQAKRSFILHELQPRIIHGPKADVIWKVLKQGSASHVTKDNRKRVLGWVNAGLAVLGQAQQKSLDCEGCKDLSKSLVDYGISVNLI